MISQVVLNALGCPEGEVSLLIIDDVQMAEYNQTYRSHEGTTNVLSFAMHDGDFSNINPHMLGDIVISAQTARQEAQKMGISFKLRFNELLIHGMLHLFGYDHDQSEEEYVRMEEKSEELLQLIENI